MDDGERGTLDEPWSRISGTESNRCVGCGHPQGVESLSQRCLADNNPAASVAGIGEGIERLAGASFRRVACGDGGRHEVLASGAEQMSEHALAPGGRSRLPAVIVGISGDVGALDGQMYKDCWPVAHIPLRAKQMVGAYRQCVPNPERVQHLPALALLAGSMLSFLAATFPAPPTGFWDYKPHRTPGRFHRLLIGQPCPKDGKLPGHLREKKSVTGHLPKGNLARCLNMAKMEAT